MAPPALFHVYSDPGPDVSEESFNDWLDNEHVPLRVEIPAFKSWTRWVAIDDKKPAWAGTYDLESADALTQPPYSLLAETRSEREKDMLKRIGLLERRTYEAYQEYPEHPPSALFDPKKPGPIVQFVGLEPKPELEDGFNKWYFEEHVPLLAAVPGFVRLRKFVLKNSVVTGAEAAGRGPAAKYLTVLEWASEDAIKTKEFQDSISTPLAVKYITNGLQREMELRLFKFYKRWERKQ